MANENTCWPARPFRFPIAAGSAMGCSSHSPDYLEHPTASPISPPPLREPRTASGSFRRLAKSTKSYLLNAAPDLKPADIQPWAAALYKESADNYRNEVRTESIACRPARKPALRLAHL